ncbi:ATP-binding protein [Streptomyces rectiverticillatus]|uniref:ATP-binding protein n=1 Tax=Streptomyces rectiverticillatus TaxID=173860 RepID=UPI0015C3B4B5|nr:ATP-binding protein [Streptomyces rectiverticillatus]QLE70511.1 ATP-binding protein [Streptomyces rectiverticillatus]
MTAPSPTRPDEATGAAAPTAADWLLARLALIEVRVRRAIAVRTGDETAGGPGGLPGPAEAPFDPFQGLYISDDAAPHLLDASTGPLPPDPAEGRLAAALRAHEEAATAAGAAPPLMRLAQEFGLGPLDVDVLLIALAPDTDARFERCYGYLNDDITCRHATTGLALTLCGVPSASATARRVFSPDGPLRAGGLLEDGDTERPYLTRPLRVPDRVTAHLLGHDALPAALRTAVRLPRPVPQLPPPGEGPLAATARHLASLLARHPSAHLRDGPGGAAGSVAETALAAVGRPALRLDLTALTDEPHPEALVRAAVLEARLRGCGLLVGPVGSAGSLGAVGSAGSLGSVGSSADVRRTRGLLAPLADLPLPVVLTGPEPWDAHWTPTPPVLVECPPFTEPERTALWRNELRALAGPAGGTGAAAAAGIDEAAAAGARYRIAPHRIPAVAASACRQADADGTPVGPAAVHAAARSWNGSTLGRLARRVRPAVSWPDLVLPERPYEQLRGLTRRIRHRDQVLGRWGMRPGGGRGRGVTALFSGASGTGKTFAAEIVAADLGLDLYVVDLATVVDKYIGETEKNLERIFTEADAVNAVLLFDEADAVFGKRTATQDAHDRYANTGTSYLLQRLESFDGLALLTTNMHANIDPAFLRRLDLVVHFPAPDATQRRALWDRCLGPGVPRAADLDEAALDALADAFDLPGGAIRCCAVTAAYRAADEGRPLGTADLLAAVREEYAKLGRYVDESRFPTTTQESRVAQADQTGQTGRPRQAGQAGQAVRVAQAVSR